MGSPTGEALTPSSNGMGAVGTAATPSSGRDSESHNDSGLDGPAAWSGAAGSVAGKSSNRIPSSHRADPSSTSGGGSGSPASVAPSFHTPASLSQAMNPSLRER